MKKNAIFLKFFFQAKFQFAASACKMHFFESTLKKMKSLVIFEHFWYPGHLHISKIEWSKNNKDIDRKIMNFLEKIVKIKKFEKNNLFFKNFIFVSHQSFTSTCIIELIGIWKHISRVWKSSKSKNQNILTVRKCLKRRKNKKKNAIFLKFFEIFFSSKISICC